MRIYLPPDVMRSIEAHAIRSYPAEAAGLLIGRDEPEARVVLEAKPQRNSFEPAEQNHRYLIDPLSMMEIEQQADQAGHAIVGVYHSHPDHPPLPSEFDRRNAWPWLIYMITSINAGNAAETRAWLLDDERRQFDEVELILREVPQEKT